MTEAFRSRVEGAVITHRGRVRDHNEDAALFGKRYASSDLDQPQVFSLGEGFPCIVAVADGIGGANGGHIASLRLVEWLEQWDDYSPAGIVKALRECNVSLFELGGHKPELAGMGAVVAGIVCGAEDLFAFNVGDCRVYRLRDGFLEQITHDDSTAQVLVDAGLAEADTPRSEKVHGITQAIGGTFEQKTIEPHVYSIRLSSLCRFLLCTDGLTDAVDLDGMEAAMSGALSPAEAGKALFDAFMRAGGKDNITIIVADVNAG
jgi:PPM family protein phosphatase